MNNTSRKTRSAINKNQEIVNNEVEEEKPTTNVDNVFSEPLVKKDKIGSDLDSQERMTQQSQEQCSQAKRRPKSMPQLVNSNSDRVRQPFKRVRPGSLTASITSSYESDSRDSENVHSPFTTVPWSPYKNPKQCLHTKVDDKKKGNCFGTTNKDSTSADTDSTLTETDSSDSPFETTNVESNLKKSDGGSDPPATAKEEIESQQIVVDDSEEPFIRDVQEESQEIDVVGVESQESDGEEVESEEINVDVCSEIVKEEGPNSSELNLDLENQSPHPLNDNSDESPIQNSNNFPDSQTLYSDSSCEPVTPPESQDKASSDLLSSIETMGSNPFDRPSPIESSPLNPSILPPSKHLGQPFNQCSISTLSTNLKIVSQLTRSAFRKDSKQKLLDLSKFAKIVDENPPRLVLSLLLWMLKDQNSWGLLATAITRQLEIKKDVVEVMHLEYPFGFLGDQIVWPSGGMKHVKTLEVHYGRRSDFSQHRKYDLLMLPKNFDWSSTFPSLVNVILYWHGQWLAQKLEVPTAHPANFRHIATSVKNLEIHTSDLLLLIGENLSSLFPQVEYLCVKDVEDFPLVCRHIWKFRHTQRLRLELLVGSRMPRNAYPHLDAAFTGLEIRESVENDLSYDESLRTHSSILDLKDLNELTITLCDTSLYPKHSYHLLTKVAGQYAFSKFGAEFRPQIVASSFYGQNTGRIVASLKSLEPYCDIRAESE